MNPPKKKTESGLLDTAMGYVPGLSDENKEAVTERVSGFTDDIMQRWEEAAEKGDNLGEKFMYFVLSFLVESDKLNEEETKAEEEAADKTGALLLEGETNAIAGSVASQLAGGPSKNEDLLTLSESVVDQMKIADKNGEAKGLKKGRMAARITKAQEKFNPTLNPEDDPLKLFEKKALMGFGLNVLVDFKRKYHTKGALADALMNVGVSMKDAPWKKWFTAERFKEIFDFGYLSDSDYISDLVGKTDIGITDVVGFSGFIIDDTLKEISSEFAKDGGNTEKAEELGGKLKGLFKTTPVKYEAEGPSLARALIIIGDIMNHPNKIPGTNQIADLLFAIDDNDLIHISNLIT
jgi:hypothetical protein